MKIEFFFFAKDFLIISGMIGSGEFGLLCDRVISAFSTDKNASNKITFKGMLMMFSKRLTMQSTSQPKQFFEEEHSEIDLSLHSVSSTYKATIAWINFSLRSLCRRCIILSASKCVSSERMKTIAVMEGDFPEETLVLQISKSHR